MLAQELRQADQAQQHAQQQQQSQQYLGVNPPGTPTHASSSGGSSGGASKFRFLGKRSNSTSAPSGARSPSFSGVSPSAAAANHGHPPPLSLNGPAGAAQGSSVSGSSTLLSSSPTFDDAFDARGPPGGGAGAGASGSSSSHSEVLLRQLSSAVATLKHQHAQLALAVRALPALPPSSSSSPTAAAAPRATSPTSPGGAAAGPISALTAPYASRSPAGVFYPSHTRGAPSRESSRASFSSLWSDGASDDWHDALPGEFVDEDSVAGLAEGEGEGEGGGRDSSPEGEREREKRDETSTVEEGGDEDEDSDGEGEETEDEYESDREAAEKAAAARIQDEGGAEGEAEAPRAGASDLESGRDVQRRSQLPAPVSGDEFSMLSMLRKNVGKVRPALLSLASCRVSSLEQRRLT